MGKKILLVEDNAELLALWRLRLEAEAFAVATASDGIEALKQAREFQPEVIVLDLVLPEMDGFGVCKRLRGDKAFRTRPIVLVSGVTSAWARQAALHAGASEYVTKPVSPEHLVSRIRHWLERGRRPDSPPRAETPRVTVEAG